MAGGGSSGQQTTTQTQVSQPWSVQQPYLREVFSEAQNRYRSGGPEYFPESTVTPFSPQTEFALQAGENRALAGNPLNFAAQARTLDTLNGQYLDQGNPWLGNVMDRVGGDVRAQVDAAYNAGNRGPSAGYAESLSRGIGDAIAPYAFGNYEAERGRMMQAAQMAPQLAMTDYQDIGMLGQIGAQREGQSQRVLNDEIARFNYDQTRPDLLLNDYLARIGGNYGGSTTSTVNQPLYSNGLATGLGALATGAGIAGTLFAPQFGVFPGLLGGSA